MPSADIVAAIDALDPVSFTGEAFRHVAETRNPLSGAGARSQGGRWNPPESFTTLYLALERGTVVNEFRRLVARAGRIPTDFLPRRLYRYRIELSALLDLRGADVRRSVGLNEEALTGDDVRRCQAVGEAAHYAGREGVIAPSAAGPGTVVAVFFDRLDADSSIRDLDYETWEGTPT